MGVLGQRLEDLDEEVDRLLPRLAGRERAAGLGRDVGCAQLGAEARGPAGCGRSGPGGNARSGSMNDGCQYGWRWSLTAFIMNALMFENASPVRSIACEMPRFWHVEQTGRPGVRHVGQQLEPLVAERGDPRGRLVEGMFQVGVGAEGEAHEAVLRSEVGDAMDRVDAIDRGAVSRGSVGSVRCRQQVELLEEVVFLDALRGS